MITVKTTKNPEKQARYQLKLYHNKTAEFWMNTKSQTDVLPFPLGTAFIFILGK